MPGITSISPPLLEIETPPTSPSDEFLAVLGAASLDIDPELDIILSGNHNNIPRYGDRYSLASGKVLRNIALREPDDPRRLEVLGVTADNAELLAEALIMDNLVNELSHREVEQLIGIELLEFKHDPTLLFNGLDYIRNFDPYWSGTRLLLNMIKDGINPVTNSGLSFPARSSLKWDICKDSEYYLWSATESRTRYENRAAVNVYVDNAGSPVLFQKVGQYKNDHSPQYSKSNLTALTLQPMTVNGVGLPLGTLVGIDVDRSVEDKYGEGRDHLYGTDVINGLLPLRLTLFSVPADEAEITFESHYRDFQTNIGARVNTVPTIDYFQRFATQVVDRN